MLKPTDLIYNVYEVIDQSTHRYSSTSISGGGVDPASGQSQGISSTINHHSDQEIWLQDVSSGKQRKLGLSAFNVDVRPGHRLIMVWDKATDRLERILNVDTQRKTHCHGIYNDWDQVHAYLRNPIGRVLNALLMAFLSLLPFIGWLFMGLKSLSSLFAGKPLGDGHFIHAGNRVAALVVFVCVLAHAMITIGIVGTSNSEHPLDYYSANAFWQLVAGTGLTYFMLPGDLLYELLFSIGIYAGGQSQWLEYWVHHSVLIGFYILITVFLVNRSMGRKIAHNERVVSELTRKIESEHPALQQSDSNTGTGTLANG